MCGCLLLLLSSQTADKNTTLKVVFDFQGGRNVLCLYGYSNQQADGLSFPDDVIDPDVGRVAAVTLEVMSLRMELEMLIKVWAPRETQTILH